MSRFVPRLTAILAFAQIVVAAGNNQITWGSVIFTYHGEKTPALANEGYNLSPLGATQLLQAGKTIRDRYVKPPTNGSQITSAAPIIGLSQDDVENTQLVIMSTVDEFVSASAMAFMQGLYPPRNTLVVNEETILSNVSVMDYPLNGYQYPNIRTISSQDYNRIWIAGNRDCALYSSAKLRTLNGPGYRADLAQAEPFYTSLQSEVFWEIDPLEVNYYNAFELYDYALYKYNHNVTTASNMNASDIEQLKIYASQQQFDLNTPNRGTTISAVAGATLASAVLQQLSEVIKSNGVSDKMTLMFGTFEPFLSFFALSHLSQGPAASIFNSLPTHGSVMSFELFSYSDVDQYNTSQPFPSTQDLWVRFLFRDGTNDTDLFNSYSLFGRGNSETDIPWTDFVNLMGDISIDRVVDWCNSCQSLSLYCEAIWANADGGSTTPTASSKKGLSPAVAGVIGAMVTLAVILLITAILAFCGFRMGKKEKPQTGLGVLRRSGSGGGFKGGEKLASDTDLRIKGGAGATVVRHERVGSWELNESSRAGNHASIDKELESGRYTRESEEGMGNVNPFGDPVKPRDQV